ncbi:SDR family oxidoreductase [Saccharothrix mutabilis subsp. mutabilis]|uniref:SDR family oxidoreductase n=1 Tax=Saccharothrix mutabilis subsp. mutabilis TaxID=66855 RepID=A0ABN0TDP1_9PSEU
MERVVERFVERGDLRVRVVEGGVSGGVVLLLVHGYPDHAGVWDGVAARLQRRFWVVRVDVRGAGGSGAPRGRGGYRVEEVVEDLVAVGRGYSGVHLVGHDWGAVIGWAAVARYPEVFRSFVSISGPDLGHVRDWVRRNWWRRPARVVGTLARSWYIAGLLVPGVAEGVWRVVGRWVGGRRELVNGLELYRANLGAGAEARRVRVPVHQVELVKDPFVGPGHLEAADRWTDELSRSRLVAGHWAPRTHPEQVARAIEDFVEGRRSKEVVVVTGGGSGIGRATALRFARDGAFVVVLDVDLEGAERTAAEVGGFGYRLDVADGAATHALAREIVQRHGVPDVVMANAGIAVAGPFLDTSEEDWRRVVDVNLWGVVHTLRAFTPYLVERGQGGNLVVTASAAGYFPMATLPAYSTTKAAVLMLAQCLDAELREHRIRVSAICPGVVDTNIAATTRFAGADDAEQERKRKKAARVYRLRGYTADRVADEVVRAVRAGRVVVPVTPEARFVQVANRIAPSLVRLLGRFT